MKLNDSNLFRQQALINGEWLDANNGEVIDVTNPANGLSMIGGYGGFDSEGNTYGTDFSNDTFRNDYSDSNGTSTFSGDW